MVGAHLKSRPAKEELQFRQSVRHEWLYSVACDPFFANKASVLRVAIAVWHRFFAENNDAAISYNQIAEFLAGFRAKSPVVVDSEAKEKKISGQRPSAVRAIRILISRKWLIVVGRRGRRGQNRYELGCGPNNIGLGKMPAGKALAYAEG